MRDYRQVKAWQQAFGIVLRLDAARKEFDATDAKGIMGLLRAAAIELTTTIAGAYGSGSRRYCARRLNRALRLTRRLERMLRFASRMGVLPADRVESYVAEVLVARAMIEKAQRELTRGRP